MQKLLLDFVKCDLFSLFIYFSRAQLYVIRSTKAHTGVYLAGHITECLHAYGVQKRILGITLDNASNNNTLINELTDSLKDYQGSATRIRCFAHILNLVVKAILSQFSKQNTMADNSNIEDLDDEFDDEEEADLNMGEDHEDDGEVIDPAIQASDALLVREVVWELDNAGSEAEISFNLSHEDIELGHCSVTKVCCSENTTTTNPNVLIW